jgi:hypothetical protein
MNKIIFLLLFSFCFIKTYSQTITYTPQTAAGYQFKYVKSDSGFALPLVDTFLRRGVNRIGVVVARPQDSLLYYWTGVKWSKVNADVSGLLSLINAKVDSVTVLGSTISYWVNGVETQYSITSLTGNLDVVTTNGNTTGNTINVGRVVSGSDISLNQATLSDVLIQLQTNFGPVIGVANRSNIKGDSITTDNDYYLPDTSGMFILSVNGIMPDKKGNVRLTSTTDSSIFYTVYRADTSRANIYSQILLKDSSLTTGFGITKTIVGNNINLKSDSSVLYTVYKADTSRANIYTSLASKIDTSLYKYNGNLTSNRTLNGKGFTLSFDSTLWTNIVGTGVGSTMLGESAVSSAIGTLAIGKTAIASADYAIAIGNASLANKLKSTAIGNFTDATGISATSIGDNAEASKDSSTAIGVDATVKFKHNIQLGTVLDTSYTDVNYLITDSSYHVANTKFVKQLIAGVGSSSDRWSLSGNTITAGQFLGTLNAQDLVLKTNNVESGRLGVSGATSYGAGSFAFDNNSTVVGSNAGANNTAVSQTAVGSNAGANNTAVSQTAVGSGAGANNTGINQTAVGESAGANNTAASQTAVGLRAGENNTGINQTAVGESAGNLNSGTDNISLGINTYNANTGNSTIGIGNQVYSTGNGFNNQIIIGHNSTDLRSFGTIIGSDISGGSSNNSITISDNSPLITSGINKFTIGINSKNYRLDFTGVTGDRDIIVNDVAGNLVVANGEGNLNEVLVSQGAGAAPIWAVPAAGATGSATVLANAIDANFTMTANAIKKLPAATLTANRTITIPVGTAGQFIELYNREAGFTWNLGGDPVYFANGTVCTSLLANTNYLIRYIDGQWEILN